VIWIALLSAMATLLGVLWLWKTIGPEGSLKREEALRRRIAGSLSPSSENLKVPAALEKTYHLSDAAIFQKFLSRYESSKEVASLLKRAQLKITVSVFFLSSLVLAVLLFIILRVYVGPWVAVLPATGAAFLPLLYLRLRNKRYLLKFSEYLPEALTIMSGAIKTGFSLQAAVEMVAKNAPHPVSVEFQAVVSEMRLGQPLQIALQDLYQRIKSLEMKIFVTGVAVQQELGGNLSEILDNLEKTIRARFALEREIKVLSAEGVFSYRVLLALPYAISLSMLALSPSLITEFFASPWGRPTLYAMLGLQLIAYLWMKKIVQLKE
jgi:tight adherence protein B